MVLVEDEAYRLCDIIKKSIKHYMLMNKMVDLQQTIDDIASHDEILKIRIIEQGKIKIASNGDEIGQLIDKKVEACNECHLENQVVKSSLGKNFRIFKDSRGRDGLGIMNPIYNESSCHPCHGNQKKLLGVLDLVISLDKVNDFLALKRNKVIFFLVLTFILISVTVGLLIRYLVCIPIKKLSKGTAMIKEGNLDHMITINTKDEIGDLAKAFNLMTTRLKSFKQEIENWNGELEKRVCLATSRLAIANKELAAINQKLKVSDQKKSEMMMAVAHDIRAPLTAAISCLKVVQSGYIDSDGEREMLKRVEDRIMEQIVFAQKLLDFSCLGDHQRPMEKMNLSMVIRKVKDSMTPLAKGKGINLEVQLGAEQLPIRGDEALLIRALTNLVDNAITYCPSKSEIRISSQCRNAGIELLVRDNGPGIPDDELPRIFDVLFRGREAKAQKGHGAGLGLSIVKQVVDLHHGQTRVESKEKKGTCFFILLPRA